MTIIERQIDPSTSFADTADRFLDVSGAWMDGCLERYAGAPPTDVHDQLTYTCGWEPYLQARNRPEAMTFLQDSRDAVRAHFMRTGQWHHGYWTMQEVHQGTEHFELFLGSLTRLIPDDTETRVQLLDAAEHFGNWSADVPPWYDPQTGIFFSLYFGADGVREDTSGWNVPDHLRCVTICLIAYSLDGGEHYLELAKDYGGLWADAVLAGAEIPVGLDAFGPLFELDRTNAQTYRERIGMTAPLTRTVDRIENIVASGGINAFLTLWTHTGQDRFLEAAERLLDALTSHVWDPDAGAVADLIRTYRRLTGRNRYDDVVRRTVAALTPFDIGAIGIQPNVMRLTRASGIGKRTDMPIWFEDRRLRRHNPILLSVAAEIDGDAALAARALDLGRVYLELGCEVLPDGRDHGCAANSVSAVALGHGRDNGAGMMTAVLGPLLELDF